MKRIQVSSNRRYVFIVPSQSAQRLPAANLGEEAPVILGQFFVAPMYLGAVARDAMGRIKQFAALRIRHSPGFCGSDGSGQKEQYDGYRFAEHFLPPEIAMRSSIRLVELQNYPACRLHMNGMGMSLL